jgi:hypothetical protein
MGNPDHIALARQTPAAWNDWRENNPVEPDLSSADLHEADLSGRDFTYTDFSGANLTRALLKDCLLNAARFVRVRAEGANLSGSNLEWIVAHDAYLTGAAILSCRADKASFEDADLSKTNLAGTRFTTSVLNGANLTSAYLVGSTFISTFMQGVSFAQSIQGLTAFVDVNLIGATGLDRCEHHSHNLIDFRTLITSAGQLPLAFLRGCGIPEGVIHQYLTHWGDFPLVSSVFISHSSLDSPFASRLYDALQERGVRCFYSCRDMRAGDPTRERLYAEIDANDLIICALSRAALSSDWVRDEIQYAFKKERETHSRLVVPVMLDDEIMTTHVGWATTLREDRHIEDFRGWEHPLSFDGSLGRLMEGLVQRGRAPN